MNARNHPTNTERLAAARQKVRSMAADARLNVRAYAKLIRAQSDELRSLTDIDSRLSMRRMIGEWRTERNIFIGQLRQLRQLLATLGEGGAL